MEKLNIAHILQDKLKDTLLYDKLRGIEVRFSHVQVSPKSKTYIIHCTTEKDGRIKELHYSAFGTECGWNEGMVVLFPSKQMQDWSKFAWKKGDVLTNIENDFHIVFDHFENDEYTLFCGKYAHDEDDEEWYTPVTSVKTEKFNKANDDVVKSHLRDIEEHYGGKLNLSTLQIEQPNPEFKDGDIMVIDEDGLAGAKCIFILRNNMSYIDEYTHYYAFLNVNDERIVLNNILYDNRTPRLATDSEKQELFDALAKKGKKWNLDTKQIENLPKKYVFAPFQKVLVRYENCQAWKADFFSYYDDSSKDFPYVCISSRSCCCIPYNDQTKHLLGTTDEWKGGEG